MLSQAVVASYTRKESDGIHFGQLTVTGISSCPYATYLNYHHLDNKAFTAEDRLRMKNGKWQEVECVADLKRAGFQMRYTGEQQMNVHVGGARIGGRPDGLITVDKREDILSIKARSLHAYTEIRNEGISAEPATMCQEQMYLASDELSDRAGCWLYVKHKDSCRPYDFFIPKDETYSRPIIEAVDEIVLGQVEVKRPNEPIDLCTKCRHKLFCWKEDLLDMSGIATKSMPEIVDLWVQGQFHLEMGKKLNEEARVILKHNLGKDDVLYVESGTILLEARKIIQHRSKIDEDKFVEKFGAANLIYVTEETEVEQMRVSRRD